VGYKLAGAVVSSASSPDSASSSTFSGFSCVSPFPFTTYQLHDRLSSITLQTFDAMLHFFKTRCCSFCYGDHGGEMINRLRKISVVTKEYRVNIDLNI